MPPAPKGNDLADQLREVIVSRGISASELAKLAGVDHRSIQRFLNGERDITLGSASRIAAALGVRLVEIGKRRK
jgi:transcriptional regulator with XRE-family HTH domain